MQPNTFHYVWLSKDEKPKLVIECIDSWKRHNPDFKIMEWTQDNIGELGPAPLFFHQAIAARKWAFATDYLRLAILHKIGGIYLDSDVLAHAPATRLLDFKGFISWESKHLLGPHVIGACAGNPVIGTWLEAYHERTFEIADGFFNQTPMPDVITAIAVDKFALRLGGSAQEIIPGFKVFTPDVSTSCINKNCIFEHLYAGGWLENAHSSFANDLARENARQIRKNEGVRGILRRIAFRRNSQDMAKRIQRMRTEVSRNLQFKEKRDSYTGKKYPIKFWHISAKRQVYSPAVRTWNAPKVSVVVPIYNVDGYLDACLRSLSRQTYYRSDFLLVDDGSTDHSSSIAEAYAKSDSRFRYFRKENGGLGSARNFGIRQADGELIAFVDSDDRVAPTYISSMVEQMGGEVDLVACDYCRILPDGRRLSSTEIGKFYGEPSSAKQLLGSDADCFAWNKLFKREAFDLPNFEFGNKWFEDFSIVPALIGAARRCGFTNTIEYSYVQRPGSILSSSHKDPRKNFDIFDAFGELVSKQAYFKPENWMFFYDWRIVKHLFFYRLEAIQSVPNPELKSELQREHVTLLKTHVPDWIETPLIREFLDVTDRKTRKSRSALISSYS